MVNIKDIEKARDSFSKFKGKEFRENQAEVIMFAMNSDKNIVVLECPTGFGKSLSGAICCKLAGDSTYLVHSKTLQQQIMEDFPEFTILMGKNNYPCLHNCGVSCADCAFINPSKCMNVDTDVCYRLIGADGKIDKCVGINSCKGYLPTCDFYDQCLYIKQKNKALASKLRVLNYVYFLLESNYVGGFSNNSLIVCDEADVLEKELLGFIQFSISENMIKKYGVGIPRYKTATAKGGIVSWKLWAKEIVKKIDIEYKEKITLETLTKKEDEYFSGTLNKLKSFISSVDESWIYDIVNPDSMNPYHVFKPVWISSTMTNDVLKRHGKKIILMSATFPDLSSISKTLGIPVKEIDYMEVPSNFRIENRPIYINPVARINSKVTDEEINKLLVRIKEIIDIHKDHKGLIHTSNYRLAYKIKEISPRMMIHNTETRMDVLEEFRRTDQPMILVSPSMERGISLPDDMARFQIIAKCLIKGTLVVMHSGELKPIENIIIGDKVMGIDGTHRTVLNTINGYGYMYKIRQCRGAKDYIVNEDHILSLQKRKCFSDGRYRKYPGGHVVCKDPYSSYPNVVNITIKEYLLKSDGWKWAFGGYKVAIEYPHKNINIDPYFLGLWLGDGDSDRVQITNYDNKVIEYIVNFCYINNLKLKIKNDTNGFPRSYYLSNGCIGKTKYRKMLSDGLYPIRNIFCEYNLINNKHIPNDYLYNTSDIRLQLLAGLIDSDGCCANGNITIIQKNEILSKQIHYLCNSLGFRCSIKKITSTIKDINFTGQYYRLNISGKLSKIPTKIDKKISRDSLKESNIHKILIEPFGMDNYCGFTLDGDGLFLLEDFTVVHNCPFLDLNDKQINTRLYSSYSGQMWYKNSTAQTIEQMCGRANRHKDDSCEIYLLDEYIKELIMKHPRMFSRYFKDCLIT